MPALLGLLLGACGLDAYNANHRGPAEESMLDELRDADLSARYPQRVKQATDGNKAQARGGKAELFPGDDAILARRQATPRGSGLRKTTEGYQLNFENANLGEVAKVILGDTLQQPFIIDPRVQGQVTLSTGRAVSKDELLAVFEAGLKLNNGALIADRNGYRIIPAGEAAAGDVGSVTPVRPGDAVQPGFGVSILPLRHVSAEAMLRLLDSFLARAGSVKAEITGNLLLIRGTGRERESIIDVAATFDVDWLKGQSAGIFPLSHATPDELIPELNQVLQNEQGELGSRLIRFQPVSRLNAILVLTRRADHLRKAAEWVKRLDRSNAAGQNLYVYQVENGKAADLAGLLNDTFGSGGGGSARRSSARSEVAPGRDVSQLSSSSSLGQPGGGGIGGGGRQPIGGPQPVVPGQPQAAQQAPLTQARAPGVPAAPSTGGVGAGRPDGQQAIDVRIIADEANNTLLIRASPSDYQKILGALRQIDRPPLQVLINATIAEVTLNDGLRYGVQFYLRANVGLDKKDSGSIGWHAGPELTLLPSFPGLNFLLGSKNDPRFILDALANVTTVKVVSSPSLVVVDNQSAVLKVGDEVPISTQQSQSTIDPNAPVINQIRFRETGVILKVTPRVNSSGLVTMDVEQEISQVAGNSKETTLTPTISQRRIASTISVYSGQTVVLGGLISEQNNRDKQGLPIINRIPLIGDVVGKNSNEQKRTELIVFIAPQVIRNGEDASRVTEELRSKLRSMAFQPLPPHHISRWHTRTVEEGDGLKR